MFNKVFLENEYYSYGHNRSSTQKQKVYTTIYEVLFHKQINEGENICLKNKKIHFIKGTRFSRKHLRTVIEQNNLNIKIKNKPDDADHIIYDLDFAEYSNLRKINTQYRNCSVYINDYKAPKVLIVRSGRRYYYRCTQDQKDQEAEATKKIVEKYIPYAPFLKSKQWISVKNLFLELNKFDSNDTNINIDFLVDMYRKSKSPDENIRKIFKDTLASVSIEENWPELFLLCIFDSFCRVRKNSYVYNEFKKRFKDWVRAQGLYLNNSIQDIEKIYSAFRKNTDNKNKSADYSLVEQFLSEYYLKDSRIFEKIELAPIFETEKEQPAQTTASQEFDWSL